MKFRQQTGNKFNHYIMLDDLRHYIIQNVLVPSQLSVHSIVM